MNLSKWLRETLIFIDLLSLVLIKQNMNNETLTLNNLSYICGQRWLKTNEIFDILNQTPSQLSSQLPPKPPSGSWFFIPTSQKRGWKKDNYNYLQRKNGQGMREDVEKLKLQGKPAVICYYSYVVSSCLEGPQSPIILNRRIYRLYDEKAEYYFVHYLNDQDFLRSRENSEPTNNSNNVDTPNSQNANENDGYFENIYLNEEQLSYNWQTDNKFDNYQQNANQIQQNPPDELLKFRIAELERRIDSLESERFGQSSTFYSQSNYIFGDETQIKIKITDYSPEWDLVDGGSKMMLCYQPLVDIQQGYIVFGDKWSEASCIQPGVLKCQVPPHDEGCVKLSVLTQGQRIDDTNDRPSFFEFKKNRKNKKQKASKNLITDDQTYKGEFKVRVIEKLNSMQTFLQQFQPTQSSSMDFEQLMEADDQKTQRYFSSILETFLKIADSFNIPDEKISEFLNQTDAQGFTLVHYLTALGYQLTIKLLLKYGIDINTVGVDGLTPLQIAILLNQENMVSFLIQHGAIDVNQVDPLFRLESVYKNRNILDLLIRGVTLCDSINSSSVTDQISWNDQEEQEDQNYFNLQELCDQIFLEHRMSEPSQNPQDEKQILDDEKEIKLKIMLSQAKQNKHHKYYRNYSRQKQNEVQSDQNDQGGEQAGDFNPNLEEKDNNYQDHVKIIQKNVRAWLLRRQYLDMKYATRVLQNCTILQLLTRLQTKNSQERFQSSELQIEDQGYFEELAEPEVNYLKKVILRKLRIHF